MIAALAGLFLPVAVAWWALRAFGLRPATDSRLTTAGVACCLGIGLSSLTTFAAVTLGFFPGPAFVATDAAGWVILGVLVRRRARRTPLHDPGGEAPAPRALTPGDWLARGAFVVVAAAAVAVPVIEYLAAPHGQWDAWAIWNQKARFLYRAGDGWTASMALTWAQPGHPVLVSASVARLWAYAGGELTAVPALLSGVYGATVIAVVMGALNVRRTRAWVAGSVLVAPFAFSHLVAAQTADLPVSMLVVASLGDAPAGRPAGLARPPKGTVRHAARRPAGRPGHVDQERGCGVSPGIGAAGRVDRATARPRARHAVVGRWSGANPGGGRLVQADSGRGGGPGLRTQHHRGRDRLSALARSPSSA